MDDPSQHALVVKALHDGLGNCVHWDMKAVERLTKNSELMDWTLPGIRKELISHVRANGGEVVKQVREVREYWKDLHDYYYKVVLPLEGFQHGLFVELILADYEDPDFPVVIIVNAHPQTR